VPIPRISVEKVRTRGIDVDVREEKAMHEGPVAAGMLPGDANKLIEVERRRVAEVHILLSVQSNELLVKE
jgi:hypothetical protein